MAIFSWLLKWIDCEDVRGCSILANPISLTTPITISTPFPGMIVGGCMYLVLIKSAGGMKSQVSSPEAHLSCSVFSLAPWDFNYTYELFPSSSSELSMTNWKSPVPRLPLTSHSRDKPANRLTLHSLKKKKNRHDAHSTLLAWLPKTGSNPAGKWLNKLWFLHTRGIPLSNTKGQTTNTQK